MLKTWHFPALAALLLMAMPALADDGADCKQAADLKLQIESCTRVIASKKSTADLVDAYAARGGAFLAKKDYDNAVHDYTEIISVAPDKTAGALAMRASVYIAEDDWSVALDDLNAALKLSPKDASLYAIRSMAYRQKGDAAKADADCKQALNLEPKTICQ